MRVLWAFCVLWLLVLVEDASVSLTSRHLLTFPIDVSSLLGVRMLSLFCSPVALLIALGSLVSLWPLFAARHTVLGSLAALSLYALTLGVGMSVSHVLSVANLRRKLLVPAAIVSIAWGASSLPRDCRTSSNCRRSWHSRRRIWLQPLPSLPLPRQR